MSRITKFLFVLGIISIIATCRKVIQIPQENPPPDCTYPGGRTCAEGPPGSGNVVQPITLTISLDLSGNASFTTPSGQVLPYYAAVYSATGLVARTPLGVYLDNSQSATIVLEEVDNQGQPTGLPKNFSAGSYTLYVGAAGNCSSCSGTPWVGKKESISISGPTVLSYSNSDFTSTMVAAKITINIGNNSVDGKQLFCIWTAPGAYSSQPAFEDLLLTGSAHPYTSLSPYFLGYSISSSSIAGGTVTTDTHWGLISGEPYDLHCWIDADGNNILSSGDYTAFQTGMPASAGPTSITLSMKTYDPDTYENDDTYSAVTTTTIATDATFQSHTIHSGDTGDFLKISIDSSSYGNYYEVQITDVQGGLQLQAQWYDGSGTPIGSAVTASAPNGDVFIPYALRNASTYYVYVRETGTATGAYKIRIVPKAERVIIETNGTANASSADTIITLYQPDGLTTMAKDASSGYGCTDDAAGAGTNDGEDDNSGPLPNFSSLDCILPFGTYYLKVTAVGTSTGSYSVSARLPDVESTACGATSDDPGDGTAITTDNDLGDMIDASTPSDDDSILTARSLKLGCYYKSSANIHLSAGTPNPDWYKITISPHGITYVLETGHGSSSANPRMELYSTDGTTRITTCYDDAQAAPTVEFVQSAQTVQEDTTVVNVQVKLSDRTTQTVKVDYSVNAASTATVGSDHSLSSGTLTIQANQNFASISFNVFTDSLTEGDETVIIDLSNPQNATLGGVTQHTVTIKDRGDSSCINSPTVEFGKAISLAQEDANSSSTTYSIPVILSECFNDGINNQVTVDYQVTGGTAVSGTDHNLPTTVQTLTFPTLNTTGTVTQYVNFQVINDTDVDDNETIILTLSNPTPGTVALGTQTTHTVTIRDDDTPSTFNAINDGQDSSSGGGNWARLYCYLAPGTYYLKVIEEGGTGGAYETAIRDPYQETSTCTWGSGNSDTYEATEANAYSNAPTLNIGCANKLTRQLSPLTDIDWFKIVIP
ncbi:MAG: hypothetical protein D6767_08340 [Candidatus Hydrogenedentota bacterium]|nr:MAG: hypothetical protein D6767_08340 [Candidatus Hydrogenedentota bacterium]